MIIHGMGQKALTNNEWRILAGLVHHPTLTDGEVAGRIGVNRSTVAAARRRFLRDDLLRAVNLPALASLGCELMCVSFDSSSSMALSDETLRRIDGTVCQGEMVHYYLEPNQSMVVQFSRDYTRAKRNIEMIEEFYRDNGNLHRGFTNCIFPLDLTNVIDYFDFKSVLEDRTGSLHGRVPGTTSPYFLEREMEPMTPVDRKVLMALVEHPALSDMELSRRISVSRISIGQKRRRFEREGLIRPIRYPNLKRLGMEVLVLMHGKFNHKLSNGLKYYIPELLDTVGPVIFAAQGKDEVVTLSVFDSFTSYRRSHNEFVTKYREHELFSEPPQKVLFSIRELREVRSHSYRGLLENLFLKEGEASP